MKWLEAIRRRAAQEGVGADELTDTLLHRTFCLEQEKFDQVLGVSVEQVKWHKAHREAVAKQQYTGARFDPELDILEIKKRVAGEMKALGIEASMRTRRHPDSLDINITDGPCKLLDDQDELTQEAVNLAWEVEDIANAYNYDRGDGWTDYYDENFGLDVTVLDRPVPFRARGDVKASVERERRFLDDEL
jgi:hypothetical protein